MKLHVEGCIQGYKKDEVVSRAAPYVGSVKVTELSMILTDGSRLNPEFMNNKAKCGIVISEGDVTSGACLLCGAFFMCRTYGVKVS